MDSDYLLLGLLAAPFLAAALARAPFFPGRFVSLAAVALSGVAAALALAAAYLVAERDAVVALDGALRLDSLGALFLAVIATSGLAVALYTRAQADEARAREQIGEKTYRGIFSAISLAVGAACLAAAAGGVLLSWAALAVALLSAARLVGLGGPEAREAAWRLTVVGAASA